MALRDAIMATLASGEASGYDLSKRFDVGVANFWTATRQQLARELAKMEQEGLIRARVVEQERRPTKRVFALTDAGHAAIFAFSLHEPRPSAIRDDLLVQVETVSLGDLHSIRRSIVARRALSVSKLAGYERAQERLRGTLTHDEYLSAGERIGPYLTLLRGILFERENLRWCDITAEALDRPAEPWGKSA